MDIPVISVGSTAFSVTYEAISRHSLALYCGGSGDHNPIHVDSDFAKSAGYDDVFAHGMLVMALLGRALTNLVRPQDLKSFDVRFLSRTHVGAVITCDALVHEVADGEIRLRLSARDELNVAKLSGYATIASHAFSGVADFA